MKAVYELSDNPSYMHINYIRCCTSMHSLIKIWEKDMHTFGE